MGPSTAMEALTAELLGDVGKLHDEVKAIGIVLPEAVAAIHLAAQEAGQSLAEAVEKAKGEFSQAAREAEVARVQAQVNELLAVVLNQVRKEASTSAPQGWKIKVAFGIGALVLLGGLAGGIIGATWFGPGTAPGGSGDDAKHLEAGRDFVQVLPQLDEATRSKLIRMIQKNRSANEKSS